MIGHIFASSVCVECRYPVYQGSSLQVSAIPAVVPAGVTASRRFTSGVQFYGSGDVSRLTLDEYVAHFDRLRGRVGKQANRTACKLCGIGADS